MRRPISATRLAIVEAFNRLVLSTRTARPPVTHVLREAAVARSTFYSHFDDRDSLLLEALKAPLGSLADNLIGGGDQNRLTGLLEHFWQQRRGATDVLQGNLAKRLVRLLAEEFVSIDPGFDRNDALRLADSQIGFIRLWVTGETPERTETLAARMAASARAYRNALP